MCYQWTRLADVRLYQKVEGTGVLVVDASAHQEKDSSDCESAISTGQLAAVTCHCTRSFFRQEAHSFFCLFDNIHRNRQLTNVLLRIKLEKKIHQLQVQLLERTCVYCSKNFFTEWSILGMHLTKR
ncbi:hypothetical protein BaRGS_00019734 [Batillaria attramentaria]|uniref:C2H2-type domain-containing protein n=1 Tax=Batillaria attramentaria TaxID=370345 RepID=A0ABD0KQ59_9CAEN